MSEFFALRRSGRCDGARESRISERVVVKRSRPTKKTHERRQLRRKARIRKQLTEKYRRAWAFFASPAW